MRKRACGSPKQPWGHRKGWLKYTNQLAGITENFARRKREYNHSFARLISDRAVQWRCGDVTIEHTADVCGHPWAWHELKMMLTSKAEELGFALTFRDVTE
jgi:transposase